MILSGNIMLNTILKHILIILGEPEWRQQPKTTSSLLCRLWYVVLDHIIIDKLKPLHFLYCDECINQNTNVSCLVGLYFPHRKQDAIRREIFKVHRKIQDQLGNGPYWPAVELHGNNLLDRKIFPNVSNDFRFEIYQDMASI